MRRTCSSIRSVSPRAPWRTRRLRCAPSSRMTLMYCPACRRCGFPPSAAAAQTCITSCATGASARPPWRRTSARRCPSRPPRFGTYSSSTSESAVAQHSSALPCARLVLGEHALLVRRRSPPRRTSSVALHTPQPPLRHSYGSGTPSRSPASSSVSPARTVDDAIVGVDRHVVALLRAAPALRRQPRQRAAKSSVMPPTKAQSRQGDHL